MSIERREISTLLALGRKFNPVIIPRLDPKAFFHRNVADV